MIYHSIQWFIGVDNEYTFYINGVQVSSANAGGYTYRWAYSGLLDSINLIQGINIIAILAEDNGGLCAFDMMLTGNPLLFNNILWSNGDTTANIMELHLAKLQLIGLHRQLMV